MKWVPGLKATGWARKVLVQGSVEVSNLGRGWCPADMISRSRTRMDLRLAEASAGTPSGKKLITWSSRLSLPSLIARPTAVEVKLLLREWRMWGVAGA